MRVFNSKEGKQKVFSSNTLTRKIFAVFMSVCLLTQSILIVNSLENKAMRGVNIFDLNISAIGTDSIKGSFYLINKNEVFFPELIYSTEVYYDYDGYSSNLISINKTTISIGKLERKHVKFTHPLLPNMPKGNYSFIIRIYSKTGEVLGVDYQSLGEMGSNQEFLQIDSQKSFFKGKGDKATALSGPSFKSEEVPVLLCTIKNLGGSNIIARPLITAYKRNDTFEKEFVYQKLSEEKFEFFPDVETDIELRLPVFEVPESYYFRIIFVDNKNNIMSGILEARYVKMGVGAKIVSVSPNYLSGKLKLLTDVIGTSDGSTVSDALMEVAAYDSSERLIFSDVKSIDIGDKLEELEFEKEVSLQKGAIKVIITIKYEGRELDKNEILYNVEDISYQAKKLKDVEGTKYEEAVNALVELRIVSGYEDNTFRPNNKITRAEFLALLLNLSGKKIETEANVENEPFNDIPRSFWARDLVLGGYKLGLLKGYPDGTFRPTMPVSYQEAITVCIKHLLPEDESSKLTVWPDDFTNTAKNLALVSEDKFWTSENATRGDIAILLNNTYKMKQDMLD